FIVWAPHAKKVEIKFSTPRPRLLPLEQYEQGYWRQLDSDISPGMDYQYLLDETIQRPDPASFYQPQGVHGPSRIIDHAAFSWTDQAWRGRPLVEFVIYELHVGTFTPQGTFAAVVPRLETLRELGITAIELMPVSQFPGERNWGYDGVNPFAVQNSYGGPEGLKTLVDACHDHHLAVILDVVYNHLGPEGNYLRDFGPYFTNRYRTPWGEAINFDGPGSDPVRRYFIANALYWLHHYHIDALRLDAIHAIYDFSAKHFLQELAEQVTEFTSRSERRCLLIAESDLNDVRVIRSPDHGGYGLDAQWNDDFHHALHSLLTDEEHGYYVDFGMLDDLAKAYREGFVYNWRYSPYRQRRHGSSSAEHPGRQLVVFSQNHDQVGNRPAGERLISLAGYEAAKTAAVAVCFSPCIPLLFMGEEYGEKVPFLYFVDFDDQNLQNAVRSGRKKEFRGFSWATEPPDPQSPETFRCYQLEWENRFRGNGRVLCDFYRELFRLRRVLPALAALDKECLAISVLSDKNLIILERWQGDCRILGLMNFSRQERPFHWPALPGRWQKLVDSAEPRWSGPGSYLPDSVGEAELVTMAPVSAALFKQTPLKERSP
ncbi:MAG: malto-oligosyltrehalose trehalohydrolase, partial [Desulfuromonadales bacterium]